MKKRLIALQKHLLFLLGMGNVFRWCLSFPDLLEKQVEFFCNFLSFFVVWFVFCLDVVVSPFHNPQQQLLL
jgi:hypothetical protein